MESDIRNRSGHWGGLGTLAERSLSSMCSQDARGGKGVERVLQRLRGGRRGLVVDLVEVELRWLS